MVVASVLLLLLAMPLLKVLQAETVALPSKALVVFIAGGVVGLLAGPGRRCWPKCFPHGFATPDWDWRIRCRMPFSRAVRG